MVQISECTLNHTLESTKTSLEKSSSAIELLYACLSSFNAPPELEDEKQIRLKSIQEVSEQLNTLYTKFVNEVYI